MSFNKLSERDILQTDLRSAPCYWWREDSETLCIACGDEGRTELSLALEAPAEHVGRSFRSDNRDLRMIYHHDVDHRRWASLVGIVTIVEESGDTLRGRFRILTKQQQYLVITGWTANQRALVIGEFLATHNPHQGRPIIERTEANGMNRN